MVVAVVVLLVEGDWRQLRQRVHDVLALQGRRQNRDQQRDSTSYLAMQAWLGCALSLVTWGHDVVSARQQSSGADKADNTKLPA